MDRTMRAAVVALAATFLIVAGAALLLGFEPLVASLAGVVLGALAGVLIWGVGRRAASFHDPDEVRPVEPGFPGPPEHREAADDGDEPGATGADTDGPDQRS